MTNKKLANRILIFLLISFIIILFFRKFILDNFVVELISFTLEAALVGGIADWFAVTAIFKQPLGFSWHTALIPKNREKVINAVSVMVEEELLSYEFIESKLEKVPIIDLLISYIDNEKTKSGIAKLIEKHGQDILVKLDTSEIAENIEVFFKTKLKNINLSLWIKKLIDWSMQNGEYERILQTSVDNLINIVSKDSTREEIYKIINEVMEQSKNKTSGIKNILLELALDIAQGTNSINLQDAAEALQKELINVLKSLKDKNDPMYEKLDKILKDAALKLEKDEEVINSVETWKNEILDRIQIKEELDKLIKGAIKATANAPALVDSNNNEVILSNNYKVIQWISSQVNKYYVSFKQDEKIKNWLEAYIKENLMKIIKAEHHLLGAMVKETLETFTNEALNEFIESKAGNDLHWIRINGSIVGAVVGLLLFLFVNLFYAPYIVPIIRGWFSI